MLVAAHEMLYRVPYEALLANFASLVEGNLVMLVQSSSFRIESFRIRIELQKCDIELIEHYNLARMAAHEMSCYVESLVYDASCCRGIGNAFKARMDVASCTVVEGAGAQLDKRPTSA